MLGLRPSFVDVRLRQENRHFCENDFGMPSSHTFLVVLLSLISLKLFNKEARLITENMSLIISYSLIITIAFTRVYLGVHTFMQVFIGGFMAMNFYLVAEYYENYALKNFIQPIVEKDSPKKRRVFKNVNFILFSYLIYATVVFVYRK